MKVERISKIKFNNYNLKQEAKKQKKKEQINKTFKEVLKEVMKGEQTNV